MPLSNSTTFLAKGNILDTKGSRKQTIVSLLLLVIYTFAFLWYYSPNALVAQW